MQFDGFTGRWQQSTRAQTVSWAVQLDRLQSIAQASPQSSDWDHVDDVLSCVTLLVLECLVDAFNNQEWDDSVVLTHHSKVEEGVATHWASCVDVELALLDQLRKLFAVLFAAVGDQIKVSGDVDLRVLLLRRQLSS